MSAASRTIHVIEPQVDVDSLTASDFSLNVAKSVADKSGKQYYNVLWRSSSPVYQTNITWPVSYAIGWTSQQTAVGAVVSIGGQWQACNKGDSWTIQPDGFYQQNDQWAAGTTQDMGAVQVVNKYNQQVQVVVGIASGGGQFSPIFVDPAKLFTNGGIGQYSPQESVMTWYDEAIVTGTMISYDSGKPNVLDCSSPAPKTGVYEWWLTFHTKDNSWTVSGSPISK